MKRITVITNYNIPDKAAVAEEVIIRFAACGAEVAVPLNAKGKLTRVTPLYMQPHRLYETAEMIAVIGGDGSILEAARRAAKRGTPILGINKGRLGYMTELELNEIAMIDDIMKGGYRLDPRSMLGIEVWSGQRKLYVSRALNDAVVSNGSISRIIDLQLYGNGELIGTYRADGLIVSTPTGSTAYSLSAGGPILDPRLRGICITPICPHSFTARPIVFPENANIEIKNVCEREPNLYLTLDGKVNIQLGHEESVRISVSDEVANLVRIKENRFYRNLYNKMNSI